MFLTYTLMYGIAINPLIDIIIVFFVIKPYKTALLSAMKAFAYRLKPRDAVESHDTIDLPILPVDRYKTARRSTLRISIVAAQ